MDVIDTEQRIERARAEERERLAKIVDAEAERQRDFAEGDVYGEEGRRRATAAWDLADMLDHLAAAIRGSN